MEFMTVCKEYLGWCPNTPAIRTAPAVLMIRNDTIQPGGTDGDAGRPGKILRGAGIVLSGIRTLRQNKQLLWYSYMTGIVMALVFISHYILRILSVYPYDAVSPLQGFILLFIIELVSVFCLTVLTAGLTLSLSKKEPGEAASFYDGMIRTRGFLHPLADWAVFVAVLGTALFVLLGIANIAIYSLTQMYLSPDQTLSLFPFRFILLPELCRIGPIGGTFAMKAAVTTSESFAAINAILFFLTMFVVPLMVLERKSLREAVFESVMLMKMVVYEAMGCFFLLVLVVSGAAATALLFPIAYGIIAPGRLQIYYPGEEWIGAAVLFMFALYGLLCIVTTIAGITFMDLYYHCAETNSRSKLETDCAIEAEPAS